MSGISVSMAKVGEIRDHAQQALQMVQQGGSLRYDSPAAGELGLARMVASINRLSSPHVNAAADALLGARDLVNEAPLGGEPTAAARATIVDHLTQALAHLDAAWHA